MIAATALILATRKPTGGGAPVAPGSRDPQQSIAVLPFDNFSNEPDSDYLSDGLTEEITTALSRIPGLKVAARNSSFTFKGRKEDVRTVAATLHVATVLEGSVRRAGKQLRVTAQLINAADVFHLWSESYDRSVDDVFAVQEDIAQRIAERLRGVKPGPTAAHSSVDPAAHTLYLQGRVHWNKRTDAGLRKAVTLFQAAIEKEPTYAAAHAGLASTFLVLPMYAPGAKNKDYLPRARAAATRALELDPASAEAHAVLAGVAEHGHDHAGAEAHYREAIRLDPNHPTTRHWYGRFLTLHDRKDEGYRQLQTALDLDPLSPVIHGALVEWQYLSGNHEKALAEAKELVEQFPDFPLGTHLMIAEQIMLQRYADAVATIEKAESVAGADLVRLTGMKAFALARSGREADARKLLEGLEERDRRGEVVGEGLSAALFGLRDYDRVLDRLEREVAEDGFDDSALCDPFIAELRALPRFQQIIKKYGKS